MTIKAVIFDMGGVLVRTENREPRAALGLRFDKTYSEMDGIVFTNKSSGRASRGEITARDHMLHVMRTLGLPETDQAIIEFRAEFFGGDEVDYSMIEEIDALRPKFRTAILSNAWDDLRGLLVERWKIDHAFDNIFISAEMGVTKPDPKIYKMVLEALGLQAEEAVFVDDFIENIEAARVLGMHGIHFQEKAQAMSELQALLKD
jgi:epoxide hydrolase-like predicted phosphatase